MRRKITVIGSANIDTILHTTKFPAIGETIFTDNILNYPGGKGLNQAIAAARLGADVTFIGALGNDANGQYLLNTLKQENIDSTHCLILANQPTGMAYIVTTNGENFIIVASGANNHLTTSYLNSLSAIIKQSDVLLLQNEIPLQSILTMIDFAHQNQIPIILNPAPSKNIPIEYLHRCDIITPNEIELFQLCEPITLKNYETAFKFLNYKVIMTHGKQGVIYSLNKQLIYQDAFEVTNVDSTGAGDAFNGALAAFWHLGIENAVTLSSAVAALSVTKMGAQSGIPTLDELKRFLTRQQINITF